MIAAMDHARIGPEALERMDTSQLRPAGTLGTELHLRPLLSYMLDRVWSRPPMSDLHVGSKYFTLAGMGGVAGAISYANAAGLYNATTANGPSASDPVAAMEVDILACATKGSSMGRLRSLVDMWCRDGRRGSTDVDGLHAALLYAQRLTRQSHDRHYLCPESMGDGTSLAWDCIVHSLCSMPSTGHDNVRNLASMILYIQPQNSTKELLSARATRARLDALQSHVLLRAMGIMGRGLGILGKEEAQPGRWLDVSNNAIETTARHQHLPR